MIARTAGPANDAGLAGGLGGQLGEYRQQEGFRLARARAGRDGQAHPVAAVVHSSASAWWVYGGS